MLFRAQDQKWLRGVQCFEKVSSKAVHGLIKLRIMLTSERLAKGDNPMNQALHKAIQLRKNGQHAAARAELVRLQQLEPDNPLINYQCAWAHDNLGLEKEAIHFYERAIAIGLKDIDLQDALLGLGSSYRCVGEHAKSVEILRQAVERFPSNKGLWVFLALSLHYAGQNTEAMAILLKNLAETTSDDSIGRYKRAILQYSNEL